ncbi:MAG TPA: IS200/IS605 family transposase [Coleofasciculaceae cyanobacterium]|jgi:putative transposase
MKLKPYGHCFGAINIHIVFVTKYRHPVITEEVESRLKSMMTKLCETQGCILLECKADLGTKDHIHLLVEMPPKLALSDLVNTLKTITSREIRKEFRDFLQPYYWKPVFWKRGYGFVSAGGASLDVLKRYIENQGYDD